MIGTSLLLDGAPLSQFELATGLAARGLEIEVLSPADGPLRERYSASSVTISIRPELVCSPAVPAWYERDVQELATLLALHRPNLVFASTIDSFPAIDAARIAGIPSIWNIRESEPWRSRLADRHTAIAARAIACFSYSEAIIFVAGASRENWRQFLPDGGGLVIRNAPNPDLLAAVQAGLHDVRSHHGIRSDEQLVVSVGTLCERKGQIDLAHALNRLSTIALSKLRVAFVGRPENGYDALVRTALSPDVARRCIFTGGVANAIDWIGSADVLINTSRSEAFPRSFIEAAAAGTPIIAANVDGVSERLADNRSALFYSPGDINALAEKLARLLADPARGRLLAQAAHADLIEAWTFGDMIESYASQIEHALGNRIDRK